MVLPIIKRSKKLWRSTCILMQLRLYTKPRYVLPYLVINYPVNAQLLNNNTPHFDSQIVVAWKSWNVSLNHLDLRILYKSHSWSHSPEIVKGKCMLRKIQLVTVEICPLSMVPSSVN
ncbi:hypothetical protein KC19_1G197300 [Ceratodon purpureus]|uniref:Uncharacterized protein n=1 Tax=Ceratodon purpureus TaxID=3225 RepID=A0A8T0J9B0_CERPU|nr:hypothetical protein KC19_1G197300 [Ceratodon purpureus]